MKKIKTTLLTVLLLGIIGSALWLPLRYHFVVFEQKTHIVQKDSLGWDQTYLNLDREPLKRRFILQSKTLRAYFMKYYSKQLMAWSKKESLSLFDRMKQSAKKMLRRAASKGGKWLKDQAPKHLKTLKQQAKDGVKEGVKLVKEKGKKWLENSGKK